jgi:S1-C subfamily serine protease
MKAKRYLLAIGLLLVLVVPMLLTPFQALALSRTLNQKVMKTVVQIFAAVQDRKGNLSPLWSGSGTIISADGLILTNCHVANPAAMWGSDYDYDVLIVAITTRSDDPPTPTYIAEVAQYDPDLDLAVIRLSGYLDGSKFDAEKLNLPYLELGDSDELEIGDTVTIFGYPGIGGETITLTSGNVSGFSRESGISGRAWIKTDATIAGGNSGGTAVNDNGILIGVPTQGGSGSGDQIVDCRYIADTNGDGRIDENDVCVPMGGFINALRPVNLAKPLIEAASRGIVAPPPTERPDNPKPPTGDAAITRPIFAPAVNEADQPVTVVESFPSGTDELYLVFDYENFQDGVSWQPVLSLDGEEIPDIWPLSNWGGGQQGTWWISIYNDPLPDGDYEFALNYDGETLATAEVTVGGTATKAPAFSDIVFSGGGEEGFLLPTDIDELNADFAFANMTRQTKWTYTWYLDGTKIDSGTGPSFSSASGMGFVTLPGSKVTDPGIYRVELYIDGNLAATSDCLVGGGGGNGGIGGDFFGSITFAEDADRNDNPVRPGTEFDSGLEALYAFFDYMGMEDGWSWVRRWYIDGDLVLETEDAWQGGEEGSWWVSVSNGNYGLPDGEYTLELLVEDQVVQSGSCTIGESSGPVTPPTQEGDVEIYGQIVDANTGQGIAGALFIVLRPGITIDEFQWTEDEVYTYAETDNKGNYTLPDMLVRDQSYSMLIGADGYEPIMEDDIYIPDDIESPFELDIELQKAQ